MNVSNLIGSNGNPVTNQFIVTSSEGKMFQSYSSNIVFVPKDGSKVRFGKDWNASKTTAKYRNQFLGETTKEIQHKMKSGEYIVDESL